MVAICFYVFYEAIVFEEKLLILIQPF